MTSLTENCPNDGLELLKATQLPEGVQQAEQLKMLDECKLQPIKIDDLQSKV